MTARRPWYKRYASDFIAGTAGLTLAQKGAYSMLLDMIYDAGGPIEDRAVGIAKVLGCSTRAWEMHRAKLIALGKIVVVKGKLSNSRAEAELGKNVRDYSVKMPKKSKPGTLNGKPNGHADLPQSTYARARDLDTRSQIQTPGAPFGKGGATPSQNSIREEKRHGRRHKATNLENWAKAVELRRRWKDHGGGNGGTEDSGELP